MASISTILLPDKEFDVEFLLPFSLSFYERSSNAEVNDCLEAKPSSMLPVFVGPLGTMSNANLTEF